MKLDKLIALSIAAAILAPGVHAQGAHGGHNSRAAQVANAEIEGLEEAGLVNKSGSGHYTVCNSGHHHVVLTHDENQMNVGGGHCVAVEAKTISVAGSDETARNSVTVHHHPHHGG